ncbi:IS701 family transposase [Streptomyces sp. NPDC048182]|uniref:IS701 family transposase n=1 Tax=Streptomyces sp. NPDC048182 TaxID=3365507 RepID=UPI003713FCF7
MSAADLPTLPSHPSRPSGSAPGATGEVLSVLRSLPRSDQRRWGELYVRGLLAVREKKTMRALAQGAGSGVEQSLYQFISKSPWNDGPVRGDLARLLDERARPRAWVVQPLVIPKVGRHSVGVERQWVSQASRLVNCQKAASVWLAWDDASCPVDWQLALPECWTDREDLRRRASIPADVGPRPPEQCGLDSVRRMSREWGLRGGPVVMDLRETAPHPVCADLVAGRIPFVVRVHPSSVTLSPPGPAELLSTLHGRRMPVEWFDHVTGTTRATAVGAARVTLCGGAARPEPPEPLDLLLLAAWAAPGARSPSEFWLSNLARSRLGSVYRTAMLRRRVERDLAEAGDDLGMRDFEGRSYRGWHHHMTMVSLAHAATALSPRRARGPLHPAGRLPGAAEVGVV